MKPKALVSIVVFAVSLLAGFSLKAQERLQESRPEVKEQKACIVVTGAVSQPARVLLTRPIRLAELIAQAGGLTDKAGNTVQILHSWVNDCSHVPPTGPASEATVGFNLYRLEEIKNGDSYDPVVQPGDVVIVQEAPVTYVVGNVFRPLTIYFKKQLTVTQALTLAGGSLPGSKLNRVVVHRQEPGSKDGFLIVVDLKKVKKGLADDLVLQPYDIVEVPGKRSDPICVFRFGPVTSPPPPASFYPASEIK